MLTRQHSRELSWVPQLNLDLLPVPAALNTNAVLIVASLSVEHGCAQATERREYVALGLALASAAHSGQIKAKRRKGRKKRQDRGI